MHPWAMRAHDRILRHPGRAELLLCPEFLGGAAAPPYQEREEFCPAPGQCVALEAWRNSVEPKFDFQGRSHGSAELLAPLFNAVTSALPHGAKFMSQVKPKPVALTIAGSDSGGGAGIQADLKTFAALGVHGASAITCITAQNPRTISRVEPCSPKMVRAQMEAVFSWSPPAAVKTGLLCSAAIVREVARFFRQTRGVPLVVDPVMVATSGRRLLPRDAVAILRRDLLPLAALVTPNLSEAEVLTGKESGRRKNFEPRPGSFINRAAARRWSKAAIWRAGTARWTFCAARKANGCCPRRGLKALPCTEQDAPIPPPSPPGWRGENRCANRWSWPRPISPPSSPRRPEAK